VIHEFILTWSVSKHNFNVFHNFNKNNIFSQFHIRKGSKKRSKFKFIEKKRGLSGPVSKLGNQK